MKMKKKTIKTISIAAGVIAAVGAGVTAVCLAIKNKKKPLMSYFSTTKPLKS